MRNACCAALDKRAILSQCALEMHTHMHSFSHANTQALRGNVNVNEKTVSKIMAQVDLNQDGKV